MIIRTVEATNGFTIPQLGFGYINQRLGYLQEEVERNCTHQISIEKQSKKQNPPSVMGFAEFSRYRTRLFTYITLNLFLFLYVLSLSEHVQILK